MIRKTSAGDGLEPQWHTSSYSGNGSEADCVEVAVASGAVHVRDSKNELGPRIGVPPTARDSFVTFASGAEL
ncbi:DUF397 domain-containing protein [[Kitasatospora] papulosa]|uniref:DUF397 domain-containing protein n=1 Tax=[Kitasatospora] papulosa TaxID=1464011 RepID=UPI0036953E7E